jgi:hypothetical protein
MAKMIPLNPSPSVSLPAEGWTLIATEAGRYGDGLRATFYACNDTLRTPGQLKLAHPNTWAAFVQEVADRSGCAPEDIVNTICEFTETIEVMLRPKPRPQPDARGPTERRQIQINGRFDREIIADAIEVLVGVNDPPTLFMRGSEFVQVARGAAEAERFDVPRLRSLVDELADCVKLVVREDSAETQPSRLPFTVCQDFLVKPLAQVFPPLSGIRTAPVFLPDGRLLAEDGYDRASGYLLRLGDLHGIKYTMPVEEARAMLQQELLGDFPLVERYSQAHAMSLLLEPFVKPLILDKTPQYNIEASTRGSGKGLLAEVACRIATGGATHVMPLTGQTAEDEKRITALLVSGASWILLDNVTELDSAPLSAVLTASIWRGRILGVSRMVSVPNDATWVATGNNIRLSSEMARRVIPIRLEPQEERPEERTGFRHHPLLDWVRDHRVELVSACLSLIYAWVDAGQPAGEKTLGSFERWARVMGGVLAHAGINGFLEGREALHTDADPETEDWKALYEHWWMVYQEGSITAKGVLGLAKQHRLLLWLWAGQNELAAQQRLGHALRGMRGRVLGRYCLRSAGRDSATKNAAYRLEIRGDPKTPETHQITENREYSQLETPSSNTQNTLSARCVSQKTPGVVVAKNHENSETFGVSGVRGCVDGVPASGRETPGARGDARAYEEL